MENKQNEINRTKKFIEQNYEFIISYDDEKSNTRLVKYKDFLRVFNNPSVMTGLLESIRDCPMDNSFGYLFFLRHYNCKKINNIKNASFDGIDGEFLFNNNFIFSSIILSDSNEFSPPQDLTNQVKNQFAQNSKNTKRGCYILITIILVIVGIFIYLS